MIQIGTNNWDLETYRKSWKDIFLILFFIFFMSGVNVNASDEQQRTALHFSASKGYSQVVNLLLQVRLTKFLYSEKATKITLLSNVK